MTSASSGYDLCIVGGGAVGLSCAYFAQKKGLSVLLVERDKVLSGCSYGNAGLIVPSHIQPLSSPGMLGKGVASLFGSSDAFKLGNPFQPDRLRWLLKFAWESRQNQTYKMQQLRDLSLESLALFKEMALDIGLKEDFQQRGLLSVHKDPKQFRKAVATSESLQNFGVSSQILSVNELLSRESCLSKAVCGAIYFREDAHIEPFSFFTRLKDVFVERGGVLQERTKFECFNTTGSRVNVIETTKGVFQARHFLFAMGAWSKTWGKVLQLSQPIEPATGYSLTLENPGFQTPLMFEDEKVVVTPMGSKLRVAGKLHFKGFKKKETKQEAFHLLDAITPYLNMSLDVKGAEAWAGLRPCTPSGLPLIDSSNSFENVTVATGHAMLGISLAPATGKIAVERL